MGKSIVGSPLLSLPVRVFFYTIRSSQTDMIFTTLKFYSIRFVPACCVYLKKKKRKVNPPDASSNITITRAILETHFCKHFKKKKRYKKNISFFIFYFLKI